MLGIVRDASDSGTFKLLEGITTEPTGTTVTGGTLAALDVGALSAGATTLSSLSLTTDLAVTHGGVLAQVLSLTTALSMVMDPAH